MDLTVVVLELEAAQAPVSR
jgi:hypothetical protein